MLDLEPIKARLAAATPGPWCYDNIGEKENCYAVGVAWRYDDDAMKPVSGHQETASDEFYTEGVCFVEEGTLSLGGSVHTNAAMIGHAPTDIAAMLAEIDTLRNCLRALANSADAVGVKHLDSDDMSDEAVSMQQITQVARHILKAS